MADGNRPEEIKMTHHPAIKSVTWTPANREPHDHCIVFPNGLGETPCTKTYFEAHELTSRLYAEMKAAEARYERSRDLVDGDEARRLYNEHGYAQHRQDQLQGDGGHLGKSIRY